MHPCEVSSTNYAYKRNGKLPAYMHAASAACGTRTVIGTHEVYRDNLRKAHVAVISNRSIRGAFDSVTSSGRPTMATMRYAAPSP